MKFNYSERNIGSTARAAETVSSARRYRAAETVSSARRYRAAETVSSARRFRAAEIKFSCRGVIRKTMGATKSDLYGSCERRGQLRDGGQSGMA
jgi:hypothetical protein